MGGAGRAVAKNVALYFWDAWMYIARLHRQRHDLETQTEQNALNENERARDFQIVWASADAGDFATP
jgi:hypothetical protein